MLSCVRMWNGVASVLLLFLISTTAFSQNAPYVQYDFITGWLYVNLLNNRLVSISIPGPRAESILRWHDGTSSNGITNWVQQYADGKEQWLGNVGPLSNEFVYPNNYTYDIAKYAHRLTYDDFGMAEIGLLDSMSPGNIVNITARIVVVHTDIFYNGDFDFDGDSDINDLNFLTRLGDLRAGITPGIPGVSEVFDLNRDTVIDWGDLLEFLDVAARSNGFAEPYFQGDADLNGHVDFADFVRLNNNWQRTGAPDGGHLSWGSGDFNSDNRVDFEDFVAQNNNWQRSNSQAIASGNIGIVPEVNGSELATIALLMTWIAWPCLYPNLHRPIA